MDQQVDKAVATVVEKFRDGDDSAATELYDLFSGQMIALVHKLVRSATHRGAIDSEGIINSGFRSFLSAIRKPTFDSRTKRVGGLLATIVARKAYAKLRRKYPHQSPSEDIQQMRDSSATILEAKWSEQEVESILREAIASTLDDMTEKEKRVLELYLDRDQERSLQEIATACRRTLTTVEDIIDRFTVALQIYLRAGERDNSQDAP